jgi:tRNA modification GTPase
VVEINCHGSTKLTQEIIEYFISRGAVMAERGEFTLRAFTNGKLDLTACEGVIDLINAQTEEQVKAAYSQMNGALQKKVSALQKEITTLIAKIEVSLDYPEEDVEATTEKETVSEIKRILGELNALKDTYKSGKIMRDGVKVAVIGKPNVGKSKLFNALVGYDRAIVTAIAGTTRDTISETYEYKGIKFVISDTAGMREAEDEVEKIGVLRAEKEAKESDVVVKVVEAGENPDDARCDVLVENKTDIRSPQLTDSVKTSAMTGAGVEKVKKAIYDAAVKGISIGESGINNLRHLGLVSEAIERTSRALDSIGKVTLDCVSSELFGAFTALGKITGVTSSDEIAGEIFSKFCVGK